MKAFVRQPPPAPWADWICRWVDRVLEKGRPVDHELHRWSKDGRSMAEWFHDTVRPAGEAEVCAYCDGLLDAQAPATIDHWVPFSVCPELALWWGNLFPACYGCQKAKLARWSPLWLRPDVDDVEALITCDLATGHLKPAPTVRDPELLRAVRETLEGLGLNRGALVRERKTFLQVLLAGAADGVMSRTRRESYHFLIRLVGSRADSV